MNVHKGLTIKELFTKRKETTEESVLSMTVAFYGGIIEEELTVKYIGGAS